MKKFEKTIITVFYLDDKVIPFFRLRKPGIRKVISVCYNVCVCVCVGTLHVQPRVRALWNAHMEKLRYGVSFFPTLLPTLMSLHLACLIVMEPL